MVRAASDKPAEVARELRQQGKYEQATRYCKQLLAKSQGKKKPPQLSRRQETDIILELSLAQIDQARITGDAEAWQAADETLTRYLARPTAPPSRRQTLLILQQALNHSARGDATLEKSQAITSYRAADRDFQSASQLAEKLRRQLTPGRTREPADEAFTKLELQSLSRQLSLTRAQTLIKLADRYDTKPDRDDALLQAVELLKPLLGQSMAAATLAEARVATVEALRKLGKHRVAQAGAIRWRAESSPFTANRLLAEQALSIWQDQGPTAATALLKQVPRPSADDALPRDLAELQIVVALWNELPTKKHASRIQTLLATIDKQGRAAAGQAATLAGNAVVETANDKNVASLVRAAEFLYRSGEHAKALAQFDRAAAVAFRQEARGTAFELSLTAAAISQALGHDDDASQRFRRAALTHVRRPGAVAAHHSALLLASESLKRAKTPTTAALKGYAKMLQEHLATWPQSPHRESIQGWQQATLYAQKDWPRVIQMLKRDPKLEQRDPQTLKQLAGAYEGRLQDSKLTQQQTVDLIAEATGLLQPVITGEDNRWPTNWSRQQRAMALALARLHQYRGPRSNEYVQRLLETAANGAPTADPLWQQQAAALRILSAVRAKKIQQAIAVSNATSLDNNKVMKELSQALSKELSKELGNSSNLKPLANLQLTLLEPFADAAWTTELRAEALEAAGNRTAALELRQALAQQAPSSADAQERAAQLLAEQDRRADKEKALAAWKQIEQRSRPGGSRWLRARQARIALLKQLNRTDEAAKLKRLTELLYPGAKVGS